MPAQLLDTQKQVFQETSSFTQTRTSYIVSRINPLPGNQRYFQIKYAVDRVVALGLLTALSPLIACLWLAVKTTSPGPGFYLQTRVGLNGKIFKVIKLRSMCCNAETNGECKWADKGDSRITPLGRLLRKLHLDELPQLWNVVRGEMSLVGPRPERPEIISALEVFIPGYHDRHTVKPGITGLAQVNLEPDTNVNQTRKKQVLDLRYIDNSNLWLDLRLVFATCMRVLGFSGTKAMNFAKLKQEIEHHELVQVGYEFNTPHEMLWTPAQGAFKSHSLKLKSANVRD